MSNEITQNSEGTYKQLISTTNPGLILILLDQSSSMEDNNKASFAATAVNQVIYEILLASRHESEIRDRCFVGVIGYGKTVDNLVGGAITQFADPDTFPPERVTTYDRRGNPQTMEMPFWVRPKAENGTPMAEALKRAHSLVESWTKKHQNSFPPVVINITDGEPNDFKKNSGEAPETESAARELRKLKTTDGRLLLFNAHISGSSTSNEVVLPHTDEMIHDPYAKLLFRISSVLPQTLMKQAHQFGLSPQTGARGMVFNANAKTLVKLLIFGSSQYR